MSKSTAILRLTSLVGLLAALGVILDAQVRVVPGSYLDSTGLTRGSVTLDSTAGRALRQLMATPGAITATPGAAGTLDDGTYAFRLVAVDEAGGTSLPGAEATCVTVAGAGAGSCALSWSAVTGAVSYRIYGSAVGAEDRYQTSTGLSYTWTTAAGATVAALPTTNTAYQFNLGGTVNWFAAELNFDLQNLVTTSTDGLVLANNTAATAAVPVQQSPRFRLRSNVWNTTTPASNTDDWWFECVPVNGATPSGLCRLASSLNGAAATYPFRVNSGGQVLVLDGTASVPSLAFANDSQRGIALVGSTAMLFTDDGTAYQMVSPGTNVWVSGVAVGWSSSANDPTVAQDVILGREAAAILQLGADAAGVTNQMLKGPDRITSDGVGGNVTIAGGRNRGASAGGSVIFQTSPAAGAGVTGTLATRARIDENGQLVLGANAAGGATTSARVTKKVTGIADNVATDVLTVTVPNANHAAGVKLTFVSSNGGADAFESSRTAEGLVVLARTTGVATVATATALESAGIATVAAGATHTLAYNVSAIAGAVGATQTFTVQVTIDDSGNLGSNQVVVLAEVLNAEATGVTIQ